MECTKLWNPFEDNELKAVICFEPESQQDAYILFLANKFGEPVPDDYANGFTVLYNSRVNGSSGSMEIKAEDKKRADGLKLFVPAWVINLEHAFDQVKKESTSAAYESGKERGKNLLQRLAAGDMTVTNFEGS